MKYLLILLAFAACTSKAPTTKAPIYDTIKVYDTIPVPMMVGSIEPEIRTVTIEKNCNHQHEIDSLKTKLFVAGYKIERIKYYVRICQKNPKQTKFLLSWVHRTVQ